MKIGTSINMSSTQSNNMNSSEVKAVETSKEITKEISNQDGQDQNGFNESLLEKAIKQANKTLDGVNKKIERQVHDVTKAVIFKVVDTETKEIIKEFPPEKIQDMIAKMWELAGLFVDERA